MNILNRLSLNLPLIQAPLEYYHEQSSLVAKVSQSGALGVYASACQTLPEISRAIDDIRCRCDKPFGVAVNVTQQHAEIDLADRSSVNRYLGSALQSLGIDGDNTPTLPSSQDVCRLLVEKAPAVIIFYNGLPAENLLHSCRHAGMLTLVVAANMLEALAVQNSSADGVVLQGLEAAGTHSRFANDLPVPDYPINTLLQQAVEAVSKPLIVWGDYQHSTHVVAALLNGADSVMLDVPFWSTRESPIPPSYRAALAQHDEMQTVVTPLWNGYPSRVIKNALTRSAQQLSQNTLQPPKQQRLLQTIIQAAVAADRADYMPLWAGLCAVSSGNRTVSELCQRYSVQLQELIGGDW